MYPWLYQDTVEEEREYSWLDDLPKAEEPVEPYKLGLNSGIEVLQTLFGQIQVQKARNSLSEFLKQGWHVTDSETPLEWSWHIQTLCDHIQEMLLDWHKATLLDENREKVFPDFVPRCQNLAINVPPGSLKSRIMSVFAPAWFWLLRPDWKLLALSANPTVADRDARLSKMLIKSDWYQQTFKPTWNILADNDALRLYINSAGGERNTRGLDAAVVGIRADGILVDDANDPKNVSEVLLDKVDRNWRGAQSRLADERVGIRINLQQRTHHKDLTGSIFRNKETRAFWDHLSIPMQYEGDLKCVACEVVHGPSFIGYVDPRTEVGEVLHPERNTPQVLLAKKTALGALDSAGQLQQRPTPPGGTIFNSKNFPTFGSIERDRKGRMILDDIVVSVDANFKDGGTSDCCIGVLGVQGPRIYILDCWMDNASYPVVKKQLTKMLEQYKKYSYILIEDKANGSALIAEFTLSFRNVIEIQPQGGKVVRAVAMAPAVEAHNILLPTNAHWKDKAVLQINGFPRAALDDFIDMLSQAVTYIRSADEAIDEMRRAFST